MIHITAHVRQDAKGDAHVAIYATDPDHIDSAEPSPFPCGVLTMSPAAGAELVARITATALGPVITPEIAAHVLHHFGATCGVQPDMFTRHLITAIASLGHDPAMRLITAYAHAVRQAATDDGIRGLQDLARQMPVPAPQGGGEHRG